MGVVIVQNNQREAFVRHYFNVPIAFVLMKFKTSFFLAHQRQELIYSEKEKRGNERK